MAQEDEVLDASAFLEQYGDKLARQSNFGGHRSNEKAYDALAAKYGFKARPETLPESPVAETEIPEELGFMDAMGEAFTNWERFIPVVSSISEVSELAELYEASKAVEGQTATQEQYEMVAKYLAHSQAEKTFGYQVGSILAQLPAFVGEFVLGGAIAKKAGMALGGKALREAIEVSGQKARDRALGKAIMSRGKAAGRAKSVERGAKLLEKGKRGVGEWAGELGGAALGRTVAIEGTTGPIGLAKDGYWGGRSGASAFRRAMSKGEMYLSPDELDNLHINFNSSIGDFTESLPAGMADMFIEYLSESMGPEIMRLPFLNLMQAGQMSIAQKFVRKGKLDSLMGKLRKGGWHGPIEEFMEERFGGVVRSMTLVGEEEFIVQYDDGGEKTYNMSSIFPEWKQIAAELTAFTVPGATAAGFTRAIHGAPTAIGELSTDLSASRTEDRQALKTFTDKILELEKEGTLPEGTLERARTGNSEERGEAFELIAANSELQELGEAAAIPQLLQASNNVTADVQAAADSFQSSFDSETDKPVTVLDTEDLSDFQQDILEIAGSVSNVRLVTGSDAFNSRATAVYDAKTDTVFINANRVNSASTLDLLSDAYGHEPIHAIDNADVEGRKEIASALSKALEETDTGNALQDQAWTKYFDKFNVLFAREKHEDFDSLDPAAKDAALEEQRKETEERLKAYAKEQGLSYEEYKRLESRAVLSEMHTPLLIFLNRLGGQEVLVELAKNNPGVIGSIRDYFVQRLNKIVGEGKLMTTQQKRYTALLNDLNAFGRDTKQSQEGKSDLEKLGFGIEDLRTSADVSDLKDMDIADLRNELTNRRQEESSKDLTEEELKELNKLSTTQLRKELTELREVKHGRNTVHVASKFAEALKALGEQTAERNKKEAEQKQGQEAETVLLFGALARAEQEVEREVEGQEEADETAQDRDGILRRIVRKAKTMAQSAAAEVELGLATSKPSEAELDLEGPTPIVRGRERQRSRGKFSSEGQARADALEDAAESDRARRAEQIPVTELTDKHSKEELYELARRHNVRSRANFRKRFSQGKLTEQEYKEALAERLLEKDSFVEEEASFREAARVADLPAPATGAELVDFLRRAALPQLDAVRLQSDYKKLTDERKRVADAMLDEQIRQAEMEELEAEQALEAEEYAVAQGELADSTGQVRLDDARNRLEELQRVRSEEEAAWETKEFIENFEEGVQLFQAPAAETLLDLAETTEGGLLRILQSQSAKGEPFLEKILEHLKETTGDRDRYDSLIREALDQLGVSTGNDVNLSKAVVNAETGYVEEGFQEATESARSTEDFLPVETMLPDFIPVKNIDWTQLSFRADLFDASDLEAAKNVWTIPGTSHAPVLDRIQELVTGKDEVLRRIASQFGVRDAATMDAFKLAEIVAVLEELHRPMQVKDAYVEIEWEQDAQGNATDLVTVEALDVYGDYSIWDGPNSESFQPYTYSDRSGTKANNKQSRKQALRKAHQFKGQILRAGSINLRHSGWKIGTTALDLAASYRTGVDAAPKSATPSNARDAARKMALDSVDPQLRELPEAAESPVRSKDPRLPGLPQPVPLDYYKPEAVYGVSVDTAEVLSESVQNIGQNIEVDKITGEILEVKYDAAYQEALAQLVAIGAAKPKSESEFPLSTAWVDKSDHSQGRRVQARTGERTEILLLPGQYLLDNPEFARNLNLHSQKPKLKRRGETRKNAMFPVGVAETDISQPMRGPGFGRPLQQVSEFTEELDLSEAAIAARKEMDSARARQSDRPVDQLARQIEPESPRTLQESLEHETKKLDEINEQVEAARQEYLESEFAASLEETPAADASPNQLLGPFLKNKSLVLKTMSGTVGRQQVIQAPSNEVLELARLALIAKRQRENVRQVKTSIDLNNQYGETTGHLGVQVVKPEGQTLQSDKAKSTVRGQLQMTAQHEQQVKAGQKTLTTRSEEYTKGFYKGDGRYSMPNGTVVNLEKRGVVSSNDTRINDQYAQAEGYKNLDDMKANVGFRRVKEWLEGKHPKQQMVIFRISPVSESSRQLMQAPGFAEEVVLPLSSNRAYMDAMRPLRRLIDASPIGSKYNEAINRPYRVSTLVRGEGAMDVPGVVRGPAPDALVVSGIVLDNESSALLESIFPKEVKEIRKAYNSASIVHATAEQHQELAGRADLEVSDFFNNSSYNHEYYLRHPHELLDARVFESNVDGQLLTGQEWLSQQQGPSADYTESWGTLLDQLQMQAERDEAISLDPMAEGRELEASEYDQPTRVAEYIRQNQVGRMLFQAPSEAVDTIWPKDSNIIREPMKGAALWNQAFIDRWTPVRLMEKSLRKMGIKLPPKLQLRLQLGLQRGKVAESQKDLERTHIRPFVEFLKKSGITWHHAGWIGMAFGAVERNEALRDIDSPRFNPSGLSKEQADKIEAWAVAKYGAENVEALRKHIQGMAEFSRQTWVEAGLMEAKDAARLKELYPNYVPLHEQEVVEGNMFVHLLMSTNAEDREVAATYSQYSASVTGIDIKSPEFQKSVGRYGVSSGLRAEVDEETTEWKQTAPGVKIGQTKVTGKRRQTTKEALSDLLNDKEPTIAVQEASNVIDRLLGQANLALYRAEVARTGQSLYELVEMLEEQPGSEAAKFATVRYQAGAKAKPTPEEISEELDEEFETYEEALAAWFKADETRNKEDYTKDVSPMFWTRDEKGMITQEQMSEWQYWSKPNVVVVSINGRRRAVTFHEDYTHIAESLKDENVNPVAKQGWVKTAGAVTRFIASMNTRWDPFFMLANFFRDAGQSYMNLSAQYGFKTANKIVNPKTMMRSLSILRKAHKREREKKYDPEAALLDPELALYERYRRSGAKITFLDIGASAGVREHRAEVGRAQNTPSGLFRAATTARTVTDWLAEKNDIVENGSRFALFMYASENGLTSEATGENMTDEEAAWASKNLTVNFEQKGTYTGLINSFYMFSNASIQSTYRMFEALTSETEDGDRKLRDNAMKTMMAGVSAGASIAILNSLVGGVDPDDEEPYWDKVPDWEKKNNLILMDPSGGSGFGAKIPLPYGYNLLYSIGSIFGEVGIGGKSIGDVPGYLFSVAMNSFNPMGGAVSGIEDVITPSAAKPVFELARNKDWKGSAIYKNRYGDATIPDSQLSFDSTNELLQATTKWLNKATGGNEFSAGWVDVNPATIQHVAEAQLGGIARTFSRILNTAKAARTDSPVQVSQIPGLRRLALQESPYQAAGAYRERRDEVLVAERQRDAGIPLSEAEERLVRLGGIRKATETAVRKLRKAQRRYPEGHPSRVALEELEKKRYDIFNRRYRMATTAVGS